MGRLDVKIVAARNLPDTETFGSPDPFVKLELENQNHKTSVEDGTVNPVWNEIFKFLIADPDSAQLKISIWNKNLVSDDFMGEYKLSLSGLTKGRVKDTWCLLQNCKSNAEIRIRVIARDFGADPPSDAEDSDPEPEPNPAAFGARNKPLPQRLAQQGVQHNVMHAQQPLPQQQQPMSMHNQQQYQQQQQQHMMGGGMYQQQQQQNQQQQMMMMQQQQQMQQQGPQIRAGPDQVWKDGETVQFRSRPLCATYTPIDEPTQWDKTAEIQQVFNNGQMQVNGGIHHVIGDPAFGRAKHFKVWYQPSESYRDGENVELKAVQPHQLVKATYGPEGTSNDFTPQLRNLIMQGQRIIHGGVHTAVGDPAPGVPKTLMIFYAAGTGIDPHKLGVLRQQFQSWDADNSGFLDRSEALAAFFSLFPGMSPTQLQQKITQSDTNGDGQLSFDEFARIAAPFCN